MERVLSKSQPLDQYDIRGILKHNHVLQLERIDSQDFFSKLDLHKILLYAYKDVLQKIPLHFAVTSPLIRARQTAEILLEGRNIPIYEDARLKEISFGVWEGLGCRKDNYEIPSEHFSYLSSI